MLRGMAPLAMNLMLALLCGTSIAIRDVDFRVPGVVPEGSFELDVHEAEALGAASMIQVGNKADAAVVKVFSQCCCRFNACSVAPRSWWSRGPEKFKLEILLGAEGVYCCQKEEWCDANGGYPFALNDFVGGERFNTSSCEALPEPDPEPVEEVVDLTSSFTADKIKKVTDCCCKAHQKWHPIDTEVQHKYQRHAYISCELIPDTAVKVYSYNGCAGFKGDFWRSFEDLANLWQYKYHQNIGKCVVPKSEALAQSVDK